MSSADPAPFLGPPSVRGICPLPSCMTASYSSRGSVRASPTPSTSARRSSPTFAASSRGSGRASQILSPSACRSPSTFAASSRGFARTSPTSSISAYRSTSTFVASSRGYGRASSTSSMSACRSTSTFAASSRGYDRALPTLSSSAWCSPSPPLVASVRVGDSSSSAPDCTSTSPVAPISAHEIAQLHRVLDSWVSSLRQQPRGSSLRPRPHCT
jgi:hypothetical protein